MSKFDYSLGAGTVATDLQTAIDNINAQTDALNSSLDDARRLFETSQVEAQAAAELAMTQADALLQQVKQLVAGLAASTTAQVTAIAAGASTTANAVTTQGTAGAVLSVAAATQAVLDAANARRIEETEMVASTNMALSLPVTRAKERVPMLDSRGNQGIRGKAR